MKLQILKMGDFYEVFHWGIKQTLFVNEDKMKCIKEMKLIKELGLDRWINQTSPGE